MSDDEQRDDGIYSPAGGSGDECDEVNDEVNEPNFEDPDLFANNESAREDHPTADVNFKCTPCSGERIPKTLNSPVEPSAEAIEQHYTNGHLPYRSWCNVCVRSKGVEAAHRSGANVADAEDRGGVPIVGIDYSALDEEIQQVEESVAKLKPTPESVRESASFRMSHSCMDSLQRARICFSTRGCSR